MTTSLKIRQWGIWATWKCFDPYWQRALCCVIMIRIRGCEGDNRGGRALSVSPPLSGWHHIITTVSQHFTFNKSHGENVIILYWHCALYFWSVNTERMRGARGPGPGKCSVRILWHLLTFIPRAPVSDQLSSASGPWWLHWIIVQRFRQMFE